MIDPFWIFFFIGMAASLIAWKAADEKPLPVGRYWVASVVAYLCVGVALWAVITGAWI